MRLLSQISRKYKETEYKKYWVVIPNSLIEKLGWKTGEELKVNIIGNTLVIEGEEKQTSLKEDLENIQKVLKTGEGKIKPSQLHRIMKIEKED